MWRMAGPTESVGPVGRGSSLKFKPRPSASGKDRSKKAGITAVVLSVEVLNDSTCNANLGRGVVVLVSA
jgi:hypothetical protein